MLYRNTNIVMLIECTSITKKNGIYSYRHKRKQEKRNKKNGKFYTIEKPIEKSLWIDY